VSAPPASPIVTFLSDFGDQDWFVGVVHGVLHEICPAAHVVDLTHGVEPGDIERAAFILEAASPDFPAGTVHLAVVDPGVGTRRRALAVRARGQLFVGPDNGLLECAIADPAAVCHSLTDERFFRLPVSRTFHGRDVFAPVAAHLARGVAPERLGPAVPDPVRLTRKACRVVDGRLEGTIMYVDRFGNGLTDLTAAILAHAFPRAAESDLTVEVVGRRLHGVAHSYGDAPIGTAVAIIGSSGRLEIAQVGGRAAPRFGFGIGDRVTVRVEP
jgi:S-adenosylmethionine hydrolase